MRKNLLSRPDVADEDPGVDVDCIRFLDNGSAMVEFVNGEACTYDFPEDTKALQAVWDRMMK